MRSILAFALSFQFTAARLLHSLPEDTFAFPKYTVTFLNGLPVLNETAQRWLQDGLQGGELEFLEQPWQDDASSPPKEIGTIEHQPPDPVSSQPSDVSLERMKFGPRNSYLCLVPRVDNALPAPEDDLEADTTPVHTWSLLQPLSGTCLYHRQGWFTYSYCHNEEIRQFRELLPPSHPHPPGGYRPEEDPSSESYTLGRAPPNSEPGVDLDIAGLDAVAANLELARGAGSRYLVQRWGDGTPCDKTGKEREVEVQFHCSMTMPDTILFVKEAKICSYVLVIHTPRLCSEPGFKSRLESREESLIRCREIVDFQPAHKPLSESNHPLDVSEEELAADNRAKDEYTGMLRRAVDLLLTHKGLKLQDGEPPHVFIEGISKDGDYIFELIDDFLDDDHVEGEVDMEAPEHNLVDDTSDSAGSGIEEKTDNDQSDERNKVVDGVRDEL